MIRVIIKFQNARNGKVKTDNRQQRRDEVELKSRWKDKKLDDVCTLCCVYDCNEQRRRPWLCNRKERSLLWLTIRSVPVTKRRV